jgi:hypothetical protein
MKTLLNCDEPYNLSPMQYPWAFEQYKQARSHGMSTAISRLDCA